jgi:hypothetical protein
MLDDRRGAITERLRLHVELDKVVKPAPKPAPGRSLSASALPKMMALRGDSVWRSAPKAFVFRFSI